MYIYWIFLYQEYVLIESKSPGCMVPIHQQKNMNFITKCLVKENKKITFSGHMQFLNSLSQFTDSAQ